MRREERKAPCSQQWGLTTARSTVGDAPLVDAQGRADRGAAAQHGGGARRREAGTRADKRELERKGKNLEMGSGSPKYIRHC